MGRGGVWGAADPARKDGKIAAPAADLGVLEAHIWKRYAIGLKYFPALPIKNIEMSRMNRQNMEGGNPNAY